MLETSTDIRTREGAEIARSAVEARLTADPHVRPSADTFRRYQDAPADTPFPLEYAFHLAGDVRGRRVLDLGCGSGRNTVLLASHGADVLGVDISEPLLGLARQRVASNGLGGSVDWLRASAHQLPIASDSVDLVFGNAVLHHLDIGRARAEIRRVLRPGGRAVFREPLRNSAVVRAVRRWIPIRPPDISPYERPLTDIDLTELAAAFSIQRLRVFALPFVRIAESIGALQRAVGPFYRADAALLHRVPRLRRYAGIVVFELTSGGICSPAAIPGGLTGVSRGEQR